jgi:hypothetical protein
VLRNLELHVVGFHIKRANYVVRDRTERGRARTLAIGTRHLGEIWDTLERDDALGNHQAAIKIIKMQGGVFGSVSDSGAFISALTQAGA